ncbi:MAG: YceI family protein [Streptomyces sp.]|uniref:YceI family protein n=1 Tax=Streptomyces sp. TaxID=1931 RepID=UPI0025DC90B5|nr:YceI family protein [Streptomyces sp.]MBW8801784.1 YceI family protein [Streptomyces sp.]
MTTSATATDTNALRARLTDGSLAGQWRLETARSTVGLRSKSMWGLAPVKGSFRELSGEGTVTPAGEATGALTVRAGSIDTKNRKRDEHLRSADFFDSANHPDIVFTAHHVTLSGVNVTVHGTLRVRDTERPVTFDTAVTVTAGEIHLDAQVPVDRSDFGMTWNQLGMASMKNLIAIHAVFVRA